MTFVSLAGSEAPCQAPHGGNFKIGSFALDGCARSEQLTFCGLGAPGILVLRQNESHSPRLEL